MRLSILILCFVTYSLGSFGQKMQFSDHFIYNSVAYKLIGSVKNNIIVWTNDDHNSSEILIFDNKLHLIQKVASSILKSGINANPEYFSLVDSFAVAYQYKIKNTVQYRLTFFDDNANQLSTIIIDSVNTNKAKTEGNNCFYKFLISEDKKTICCTKLLFNADDAVININCTFVSSGIVSYEEFLLPFDFVHEKIHDFLIDGNKNFLLLETISSDSSFALKIVKKVFINDYLLTVSKKIDSGILVNGSINLTVKPDSYMVYACWQKSLNTANKERHYLTGFYKWVTNFNLDDKPGDTILNEGISATNCNIIFIKSEKNQDFFAIEKYKKDTSANSNYAENYGTSSWQNDLIKTVDLSSRPQISEADKMELGIANHYQVFSPPPSTSQVVKPVVNTIATGINIFSLSNSNQLNWLRSFDNNTQLNQNLNNKIITAGTNGIYIIYPEQLTNHKIGITQIIISKGDGSFKIDNVPIWNSSYTYLFDQETELDHNGIVMPCYKSNKIFFVKLSFE